MHYDVVLKLANKHYDDLNCGHAGAFDCERTDEDCRD